MFFCLLNDLNIKFKGSNIFQYIEGFQIMLKVWQGRPKNDHPNYYMFPTLLQHTADNVVEDDILIKLQLEILSHLTFLSQSFNNYFP